VKALCGLILFGLRDRAHGSAREAVQAPLLLLGLLAVLFWAGMASPPAARAHEGEQHGTPPPTTIGLGPVKLSEDAKRNLDLQVEDVGQRDLEGLVNCFGTVHPIPGRVSWSTARIAGTVKTVRVSPGDLVRAGDVLAEVEARQVAESPVVVRIQSAISGRVMERGVTVGQPVDPSVTLFKIADLSEVYLECRIYEADIARIRLGQTVRFFPEGMPGVSFEGRIERLGGKLTEEGRTLPVWARIPNSGASLRPGMQGRAAVVAEEAKQAVSVPVAAVLGDAGNFFVFLENGEYYVGEPVGLGLRDTTFVEITDGLLPGDRVVTRGAYQLQFAAAAAAAVTAPVASAGAGGKAGPHVPSDPETGETPKSRNSTGAPAAAAAEPQPGIRLSEVARKNLGLVVEEIDSRSVDQIVRSFGVVEAVPDRARVITTTVPGRATRVLAGDGQQVRKGDLLATIESRQVAEPPAVIEVRAPRSGTVVQQHVQGGESVEPQEPLFTIVDLAKVLIRSHVYEEDEGLVRVGQMARIVSEAYPGETFAGTVQSIGGELEPGSKTLPVWVEVSNPDGKLRLNMLTEVHLTVGQQTEDVAVPLGALLGHESNWFVFVQDGGNLKKQPVSVGRSDDRYAEVLDGLLPGDQVVVRGAEALEFAVSSPAASPADTSPAGTSPAKDQGVKP
jgi:membrane fusion protein, heavy metal efflux system